MTYSDSEFGERFSAAFARVVQVNPFEFTVRIEGGWTGKPRASNIFGCARQQLFQLMELEMVSTENGTSLWAPTMGWAGEVLNRMALREMGYTVTEPELPDDQPFSGHMDSVLQGLDLDEPHVWDSKVRSIYGMKKFLRGSFPNVDPQMYGQMQAYMLATGVKHTMITLHPHDVAEMRSQLKWKSNTDLFMANPMVHRMFIDADDEAQDIVMRRAEGLVSANALGLMVHREYNPGANRFPCTYCAFIEDCIAADMEYSTKPNEVVTIEPIPEAWREVS